MKNITITKPERRPVSDGFVLQFLTAAVARGEDPDVVLETMRIKYEGWNP